MEDKSPLQLVGPSGRQGNAYKLWSIDDLDALPASEWLISPLLPANSHALLIGAPGDGKSFVALSFALAVASGRDWLGHGVRQGPVLYVAAEGGHGIRKRIRAWQNEHRAEAPESMFVLLDAPQLRSEQDIQRVLKALKVLQLDPALIVIDTLARTLVGGDENAAKDMGEWINGALRLQKQTRATVLALHHTLKRPKKNGPITERGSSALRGAVDTVMDVVKRGSVLTLSCQKQKDAEEFERKSLLLKQVDASSNAYNPERSLVVIAGDASLEAFPPTLSRGATLALDSFTPIAGPEVSKADWKAEVDKASPTHVPDRTFMNWIDELLAAGEIERPRRGCYRRCATATQVPTTAIQEAA